MPTNAETKSTDKTQAPRYLPLRTVSVDLSAAGLEGQRVFGIVANISETGACVIMNREVDVDAAVELYFVVSDGAARTTVRARVVWCAERLEPIKEIVGFLVGVLFLDTPEHVRALLASGIFQPVP